MATQILLYQGDVPPDLLAYVLNPDDTPVSPDTITAISFYLGQDRSNRIINGAALTLADASKGLWKYSWQATDTATPGDYQAEIVVTYPGGKPVTLVQFVVRILESLH